jgi:hypothetical protein
MLPRRIGQAELLGREPGSLGRTQTVRRLTSALVVGMIVGLIVVGFYRNWFALSSRRGIDGNSKVQVNLTVNPDIMKDDAEKLKNKTTEIAGK